jgi:ABC-2 type transport system ATP-binding protein
MIELRHVSKFYRSARGPDGARALTGVTLTIPRGQVWGVVGPNGAGKSTLFSLILGFLRPTDGAVLVAGVSPRRYLRGSGAGYLPERFELPGEWRVGPALRALAELEGVPEAEARAESQLEKFGLSEHAGKEVRALSRGLLQRLGLAQATLAARDLVVLDEPTEGLDPLWRVRFRALIEELKHAGRTVLIASHDLTEVERLAERVIVLDAGSVVQVLDLTAQPPSVQQYAIALASPSAAMLIAFPDAVAIEGSNVLFAVRVHGPTELSRGLAALLDGGALLVSAQPMEEGLEQRVRRVLRDGESG